MRKNISLIAGLFIFILPLVACFGPKSPQEVAENFWEAVLEKSSGDVIEYSTLTDPSYYDGFSKEWSGYQSSFGKIIIEDKRASIETEMIGPANSGQEANRFTTYLVLRKEKWIVDYERTKLSIHGGPLGELFSKLDQVGNDLSKQLESSADAFKQEMDRLGEELEKLSESFGLKASKSIEQYAEQLQGDLKRLVQSINRALEEEGGNLSNDDRRVLQEIATDLDDESENLSDPSVEAITRGGRKLGEKQQQLEAIDNDSLDQYKQEWHTLSRQFEELIRQMMKELSTQERSDKSNDASF